MATNSNRFPLQNSIKKILDDPNSRPALPALENGSIVGDGNFGKGDRYDTGKWSDIALNNGNVVVEVHNTTDSKSLYYHVGKVNGGKIDWDESHYYDKGVRPSVAINNNGLVVEVHKSQGLKNTLWYRLGQVEGGTIKWRNNDKSTEYGVGLEPSVAITDDELVVEVHQSIIHDDGSGQLYYHVGKVKGDTIDWGKSHYYDNGVQPSVAITNDELVVEVHTSQNFNTLYYHVGKVKGDNTIDWGKSHYYNDGVHPSVAITNDRLVVEVHQSQSHNTLWYRGTGKVNNNTIDGWDDKKKSQNYGDGTTPRVACNGRVAVETHSGADNQLLSSVLTLPAFRGKWIELHGDNSYCYCACNSATDNKHRHASSHTMNVKAGAPYFYAVLTKDDDTVDFPTGAVLTIEGPDGTKYDRNIKEENQLVIMSGSSVRCLIVKDPKPGDWKMTMTVPEGVGFQCECNTLPSKDVYDTITETLDNSLQKRGLDIDNSAMGWHGTALLGAMNFFPSPAQPGKELPALFMADSAGLGYYVQAGESGDEQNVDLPKDIKLEFGSGFGKSVSEEYIQSKATKTGERIKDIASTTTKKKKKGVTEFVYAVAHDGQQGNFIIGVKNQYGRFFQTRSDGVTNPSQGRVLPAPGQALRGGGDYALPGGALKNRESPIIGAWREFFEETDEILHADLTNPLLYIGSEPPNSPNPRIRYYGVFFNLGQNFFPVFRTIAERNLEQGKRAAQAADQYLGRYNELRENFPGCPPDNELNTVQLWNLINNWQTIQGWQLDPNKSWYCHILTDLRLKLGI